MNARWTFFKAVLKKMLQRLITMAVYNKEANFSESRASEWGHVCQYSAWIWERSLTELSIDNFPSMVIDGDLSANVRDIICRPKISSLNVLQWVNNNIFMCTKHKVPIYSIPLYFTFLAPNCFATLWHILNSTFSVFPFFFQGEFMMLMNTCKIKITN